MRALLGVLLLLLACGDAPGPKRGETIVTGQKELVLTAIETESRPFALGAGEARYRDFDLEGGDFLQVVVEQRGLDVVLHWLDPAGEERLRIDSPNGEQGPEELVDIVAQPGRYRLIVVPPEAGPIAGELAFRQLARRPATTADRRLVEGDHGYRRGRELGKQRAWKEAATELGRAVETFQQLGLGAREAEALHQLGVAHQQLGEWKQARETLESALAWYRVLGERRRSYVLHDLGKIHLRLGDPETAIRRLEEALALFTEQRAERGIVSTHAALGAAFRTRGELQRALAALEAAVEHSRRLQDAELEASLRVDRAALLLELDRGADAETDYHRALTLYRGLGDTRHTATALRGLADTAIRQGDLEDAERCAREALEILETEGEDSDRAAALSAWGNARRRLRNFSGARVALEEALVLARRTGQRRAEAVILTSLAQVLFETGEPAQALALHEQALHVFQAMNSRTGEATARVRSAQALHALGRSTEAWQRLEPALALVEAIRAEAWRQDYRLSYFGSRQEYFEIAVELLLELDRHEPGAGHAARALEIHDRRLARELRDALALGDETLWSTEPALLLRASALESQLSELSSQPSGARDRRSAVLIEELHRLRGQIEGRRRIGYGAATGVSLETARRELLDRGSLLLVYALGSERGHLFEVSQDHFRVHPLPARQVLETAAEDFLGALRQTNHRSQLRREALARELGQLLLGPVGERIASWERLVVIADGALQGLPWSALTLPGTADQLVVETHEVVYLPSLSMLAELRTAEAERPERRRSAIFADPLLETDRRLPGSRAEAEAIAGLLSGAEPPLLALGAEARRERFLEQAWGGFSLLYFATHAVAQSRPELSGLLLSREDQTDRPGFVTALEISRLRLPVDLVVLSACETGVGTAARGEGRLGLAWSFLQAGAARVVASQWRVDDRRTAELMTRFFTLYHQRGMSPAAALHQAQLEMSRRPGTLPYDWAGFELIGDWRSPKNRRRENR